MFGKTNKKATKVLAYLLALMVLVSYYPSEFIMTALAETQVAYKITVTDEGSNPLKDTEIEITALENFSVQTITTNENGVAVIDLIDGKEYLFDASKDGYDEAVTPSGIIINAASPELTIVMAELPEVQVSGIVTDESGNPYNNAEVIFTCVGFKKIVNTNELGEYSLICYKNLDNDDITYNVTINPDSNDEAKYAVVKSTFNTGTASPVNFQFELKKHKISLEKTGSGTVKFYSAEAPSTEITGESLKSIAYGTDIIVEVEAAEDYRIKENSFSVTVCEDEALDNDGKYEFTVTDTTIVSVDFEKYVFGVTGELSTEEGSVTLKDLQGNTITKAEKDSKIQVNVTPKDDYCINELTITNGSDDVSTEDINFPYELEVKGDVNVVATFKPIEYTLTFTVGADGKVKYPDSIEYVSGGAVKTVKKADGTYTFSAQANTGYHVEAIKIKRVNKSEFDDNSLLDGGNEDVTVTKTISDITSDVTVEVVFAINTYEVTIPNSIADGSVSVDATTVNHGEQVKLTVKVDKPDEKKIKTIELVSGTGTIGEFVSIEKKGKYTGNYEKFEITISDISEDIQVNVVIDDKEQLTHAEGWSHFVTITPTSGSLISKTTDSDGNDVLTYSYRTELEMRPADGYDKVDYLTTGSDDYANMKNKHEIKSSKSIEVLQVDDKGVSLNGKKLIIIIDNTKPTITIDSTLPIVDNAIVTNADTVTISGIVTDENTTTNPSSGLDRVVYATGTEQPADEAAVKALTTEATLTDGKFEINVVGTAELNTTYYIYAIDTAGNVSEAKVVNVVIDKTQPTVSDVKSSANGKPTNKEVTISFTAADTNADATLISGLDKVVYTTDGNLEDAEILALTTEATLTDGKYSFKVTDTANKNITYYIYAIDKAGNISEKDQMEVWITTVLPVVASLNKNPNSEWTNKEVTLSGEVNKQENGSNINRVVYTTDGNLKDAKILELTDKATLTNGEYSFKVSGDQNKTYYVYAIDDAGNVSTAKPIDVKIDKAIPVVTGFKFESDENNAIENAINFLTFGTFFNEKITVTADVTDDAAGCNNVVFYLYEDATEAKLIKEIKPEDGKWSADIDIEFTGVVKAVVYDKAGNVSEKTLATSENSNIKSSNIMIEKTYPTIEKLNITGEDGLIKYEIKTKDNGITWWYNKDVDFNFNVADVDSGIRSVVVKINNIEIKKDKTGEDIKDDYYKLDEKTTNLDFTVSTAGLKADVDGSYTLNVEVTDNAGNVSKMLPVKVYKDTSAPKIKNNGFKFVGYDGTAACAEVTDYGFFFKQETTVTISAIDEVPTSGIKEITYYTVDIDNGKTAETVKAVDENGEIKVTIPANFKGQIYAKVNDNVLNTSEFVSPDKAVVESEEKHKQEKHIEIIPAETTLKTTDNSPLYKDDVEVKVIVTDTYSGIDSIEWSIDDPLTDAVNGKIQVGNADGKNVGDEIDGWKIESKDANLVTKMSKTITVSNNSNDIDVVVKMTDRAGNITDGNESDGEGKVTFNIDKTEPEIEVTYDNNTPDATYKDFYKENRTATITVTERNFNADDVKIAITNTDNVIPKLSEWKTVVNEENPDLTTHTATIVYEADGDYKFDVAYSDLATNPAADFEEQSFTIDKTKPVVKVTYDNNKALNKNYYAAERTATITVTEHNFDENRIVVSGKATDNGKKVTFPAVSEWTRNGDIYTATISYKADAKYTFDIKATDKAGNVYDSYKAEEFYIDKTAPEVEITGVANNSANNGKVAPVVKYTDTNFTENGVTVTLSGVNRGKVDYSRGVAGIANGQTMSYENFRTVKEVDDIYTLTAKVVDMAGNETTKSITFSVNRFGSTYNLESIKSYNNKYLQTMGDLVFTEVNVNSLDLGNIKVKLTKNGTPSDLVLNKDFTVDVSGGNGRWYTYTYTIKSALFEDDARYALSFYSVDASGNINENIDETKEAVVSFGVDKTKPAVVPIDLKDSERYKESVKQVTIDVKDNLSLEGVKIYLNDVEVKCEVNGESYTFSVPESRERQTIKVVAIDAAGNEQVTIIKDILVSTNAFVQWVNNTEAFVGTIAAVVLVVGGIVAFAVLRKKKRRK